MFFKLVNAPRALLFLLSLLAGGVLRLVTAGYTAAQQSAESTKHGSHARNDVGFRREARLFLMRGLVLLRCCHFGLVHLSGFARKAFVEHIRRILLAQA